MGSDGCDSMTATALTLTFVEPGVLPPEKALRRGVKNDGVLMGVFEVAVVTQLVFSKATRAPFALPTELPVTPVAG